jgi:hypothetical protein
MSKIIPLKPPPAKAAPPKPAKSTPPKPAAGKSTPSAAPVKPPLPKAGMTAAAVPRPKNGYPGFRLNTVTAEMQAIAKGQPLARGMLLALKHEGKPSHLSDEKYLQRFARFGWHEEEDEAARKLLKVWGRQPSIPEDELDGLLDQVGNYALDANQAEQQALLARYLSGELTAAEYRQSLSVLDQTRLEIETMLEGIMSLQEAEEFLEMTLGYDLQLGSDITATELTTFVEGNLAIIEYLNEVTNGNGLQAFIQIWSQNPDGQQVLIQFGDIAEGQTGGDVYGFVPQPESSDDAIGLRSIYLGSGVNVATLVHEFGHHLDRWFKLRQDPAFGGQGGLTGYLTSINPESGFSNMYDITSAQYNLNIEFTANALQGFAGKQFLPSEYFADLFMTAVLDRRGETVYSLDIDQLDTRVRQEISVAIGQEFVDCQDGSTSITVNGETYTIPCGDQVVGWQDSEVGAAMDGFLLGAFSSLGG